MDAEMLERYWGPEASNGSAPADGSVRRAVRAASIALYSGSPGAVSVVPRVDLPRQRSPWGMDRVRANAVLMKAPWTVGFKMGAIPIKVFRQTDPVGGGHPIPTEAPDHPGYQLIRRPAEIEVPLTRNHLVSGTVASMIMYGKGAWWKDRNPGEPPSGLWPIPGRFIRPIADPRGLVGRYSLSVPGQPVKPLRVEDVCYFRLMPDPDNWLEGWSPFQALFAAGDVAAGAAGSWQQVFRTGVLQRLWVALKGKIDDEVAFSRLEAQLEKMVGAGQGIPLLEEEAELKTAGDGPNRELLQASWDWAVALVDWLFDLKGDRSDFYGDVVAPIADAIEQELERSLFEMEFPNDRAYPQFMYRSILIGSPKEQAEYWQTRIQSGQASPNMALVAQDAAPVDGGDALYVPLNMVAITPGDASPAALPGAPSPPKDSSGGLGGEQGKGTQPTAGQGVGAKVAAWNQRAQMRAERRSNWGTVRARVLEAHAGAMSRRMRGVLAKEQKAIAAALIPGGRLRQHQQPLPPLDELLPLIEQSDPEIAAILKSQMDAVAREAASHAAKFLGPNEEAEVRAAVFDLVNSRSTLVAERFSDYRARGLRNTLLAWSQQGNELAGVSGVADIRDLATLLDSWGTQAAHFVDGIARTESAFAFERSAMVTWADAGITLTDFVFGGGPCRTGVCEEQAAASPMQMGTGLDNVGATFEGTDAPPLHPSCTCYLVPSEVQDLSQIPAPEPISAAVSTAGFDAKYSTKAAKDARAFLRRGLTSTQMRGGQEAIEAKRTINQELVARLRSNPDFMKWWNDNGFTTQEWVGGSTQGYADVKITDLVDAVDRLVRQWASTSGDSSAPAIATQLAARAEFDLMKSALWWGAHAPQVLAEAQRLLAANETFLRTALRAMYDWTQEEFAARGITEVSLVRGQSFSGTGVAIGARGEKTVAEVLLQPMSSFSTEAGKAGQFASGMSPGVIRTTIPVERIIGSCRTGFGCLNEHEFVVLSSDGEVEITWR